jgi:hypothetical protein
LHGVSPRLTSSQLPLWAPLNVEIGELARRLPGSGAGRSAAVTLQDEPSEVITGSPGRSSSRVRTPSHKAVGMAQLPPLRKGSPIPQTLVVSVASVAAIVGAVTAIAAAVFSGLTLHLSGKRETRKWIRESLLDALTQCLDASFMRPSRRVYLLLSDPAFSGDLASYRRRAEEAHRSQNDALTKIRLLASRSVVQAAEGLHRADEAVVEAVLSDGRPAPEHEWERLRAKQKIARELLISEAREVLGLDKGAPIMSA